MANIIIKSDERRAFENRCASQFGLSMEKHGEGRDQAEIIAARTHEAVSEMEKIRRNHD